ncbi:MAG: arsenosugar biosynthesis radical SAM (seleno)protein ArsS [Pseudomonadota bacterium]
MTSTIPSFSQTLEQYDIALKRNKTTTLQVNLGLLCNQVCKHCHLSAGPDKQEVMTKYTMNQVTAFAKKGHFDIIDITGGAPEMNPNLAYLINTLSGIATTIMLRSNLSTLFDQTNDKLLDTLKNNKVVIVASFPSLDQHQTDSQRGKGIFDKSIQALIQLNKLGYGEKDTGLELNLVANPTGAYLPSSQEATQKRYRQIFNKKYNIVFNNAYTFANMPLGRFKDWLIRTENYENYIKELYKNFNVCTIDGLMCKNLVSVSWNGYLFDCDFNLAADLHKSNQKIHISKADPGSFENDPIVVDNHCYACTAGSGFT